MTTFSIACGAIWVITASALLIVAEPRLGVVGIVLLAPNFVSLIVGTLGLLLDGRQTRHPRAVLVVVLHATAAVLCVCVLVQAFILRK